ncbi:hypothetical protein Bhyg_08306, partial [Pseudolycoriella hygida]
ICNGHAISDYEIKDVGVFTKAHCITKGKLFTSIESRRRAIKEGDEILNCYGPNHKLISRAERQELLNQQYSFQCNCSSCSGTDENYLNCHIYLCPCGADVPIFNEKSRWWRNSTKESLPKSIICSSCSRLMKLDWIIRFRQAMEEWDCEFDNVEYSAKIDSGFLKVIVEYENACKFCKGDNNSQKVDMSSIIVKYITQYINLPSFRLTRPIAETYERIRNICMNLLRGYEYEFGRHSLEYLSVVAALMDINAIFGQSSEGFMDLNNFNCLSDRTRTIFLNYNKNHVQKFQK